MSKEKLYELKKWTHTDDMHIDFREIDSYNKTFNYIVCSRNAGKSVQLWKKLYNTFKKTGAPSIVLRRNIVDITSQYVDDIATLINKFTDNNIEFDYKKSDIKQGMLDIRLNGKIFFRVIALSAPMNRLKSMVLRNVAYMIFDEYIVNQRLGEKYLKSEVMRVFEIYSTYNRESPKPIKCYFAANPYSFFCPYFTYHKVDSRKLAPGVTLCGSNWVVWCYKLKPELVDYLKKTNPLFENDEDDYYKYAMEGININDQNKKILDKQPEQFKLNIVFKIDGQLLGVFRNYGYFISRTKDMVDLEYWVRIVNPNEISQNRDVLIFDFSEMADNTILMNKIERMDLVRLKEAIEYRNIAYKNLDAAYLMEEIYTNI